MTSDPRVPSETLYVVSAYEDGADYRLCRNFAEIRAAYIELCCGSDDPWHQDEINAAMAAIADEDNWNVDSVSVGVGDCGQFQVTKYPAHLFRAQLAQAEPVAWRECPNQDCRINARCAWPADCDVLKAREAWEPVLVNHAQADEDMHCSICGLPWPDERETLEPHVCPPGFQHDRLAQWQPIETAPKDGTRIILSWGGKVFQGFYLDNSKSLAPWRGFRPMSGEVTPPGTPDYWMSLPAAPGSEGRNG